MTPPPYAIGIDTEVTRLRDADRLLLELMAELDLPDSVFGCTHLVRDGGRPRVALSLAAGERAVVDAARAGLAGRGHAVTDGAWDAAGRAVVFPGVAALTGTLTVAELVGRSAIAGVRVLGTAAAPEPDTVLVTREFVRPQWEDGALVLAAMPAVGGTLVPFEDPDPTPCCADH
ncbi:hypothetical protein [Streptomyces longispororuber]|uniref:hypothetical protein n=1 Tax=Streptomyces longispororuber TaxID=68230 RepID=UPI00210A616D|nr:hypothetical protein [Streptomyces longispororuber]MCQ4210848.1 hypothetical protein [Streptomyces longispororuber]